MSAHNSVQYIAHHQNMSVEHPVNRVDVRTMEATPRTDACKEAGEEVVTIHKKLQQETENIIRWKASSEVNTKQLELLLEEARGNLNDLRRNLIELQSTNENLSQSLIREREERVLTNTKVMHTRELISSLQQQFQELESTVNVFHQEKQYHCAVQDETVERLNILSGNFKELSLLSEEKLKVITDKAKEDTLCLQNKIYVLDHNIETKISECNLHLAVIEEHKKEISDLTCRLNSANTLASETEEKCVQLNRNLDELQSTLAEKLVDLQNQESENLQIKEELKEEQLRLKQSKSEFQEAVEKIKFLKNANNVLEGAQSEITEQLEAITSLKFEIEKDIEQKYQVIENLQAEKGALLREIDELKQSLEKLTIQLQTKDENYKTLVREKEELLEQNESINLQLVNEQERVKELQEKLSSVTENLQGIESLVKELKNAEEINVQFINKLQEELQEKEIKVKEKNDEIESLVQKIKEFQETEMHLNENLSSFQNEKTALRVTMEQQLEIFKGEKKTLSENFAVAEGSLKEMVEDLRIQIESEREKFENDKNSWETMLLEKDTSAEQMKQDLLTTILNLEAELMEARDNLEDQAEFTRKEMDDLSCKTLSEKSLLEEEKQSLDERYQKIKKSYATLQNKHENLAEELKSLKSHSKEQQDDLKAKNKKIQQSEKKLEKLEKSVANLKANADKLQEKNREFEEKCQELKKKIEYYEENQDKSKENFNAEVRALEEELQKEKNNRENLEEELKNKKQEFESFHNNTSEKMQKMNEDMQKLLSCHQSQIDTLEQEKEKIEKEKQEIEQQTSIKVNYVEAETDKKIKQMADLLARYKSEYEEKLAEAESQMRHLQVAHEEAQSNEDFLKKEKHISSEDSHHRGSLYTSNSSALPPASDNERKAESTQGRTKFSKISTAHTEVVDETPSSYQYSKDPFIFKEPPLPKDSNYCSSLKQSEEGLGHKDLSSSILKSKRTLLPAVTQKHVMFKLPQPCANSGDSSSDACTFEVVDSDDVFEEVMISGRRSNFGRYRSNVKPLANVLPMRVSNASDGENNFPKIAEDHMSLSQGSRGPPSYTKAGKFFRDKKRKKEFKTYSTKKSPGTGHISFP